MRFCAKVFFAVVFLATLRIEAVPAIELSLPIRCEPGVDCWIPRYVDHDLSEGVSDYACGTLTGDGHKGTDFAIPDYRQMQQGVDVVASADGVVLGTRDGMDDVDVTMIGHQSIAGRECGNGVLLGHADGFETQYCHLKKGSIAVSKGDTIARGQVLGLIGLSGDTSFPHVHLSVRHQGKAIDPFTGMAMGETEACGVTSASLWSADIADDLVYEPLIIRNMAFANQALEWDDVKNGLLGDMIPSAESAALVVAFDGFGLHKGDRIVTEIEGPDGWRFENTEVAERSRAAFFRFGGRRAPRGGLFKGVYRGKLSIERPGQGVIASKLLTMELR